MVVGVRAQMKIQQMAFMIVGLFFFFTLVGLFVLNISVKSIDRQADALARGSAIASLRTISNMPEFACGSGEEWCLDEDKLRVMSGDSSGVYDLFWPVASIQVYKVYPGDMDVVTCPAANCNQFDIFDSGQSQRSEYSTFVSICRVVKESNYVRDDCSIGKLVVGVIENG